MHYFPYKENKMSVLKGKFVIIFPQDKHGIKEQATMKLYKMQNSPMQAASASGMQIKM